MLGAPCINFDGLVSYPVIPPFSFGEEEPTEPQLPLTWKLAPAEYGAHSESPPRTFVTFIFRYRSQGE